MATDPHYYFVFAIKLFFVNRKWYLRMFLRNLVPVMTVYNHSPHIIDADLLMQTIAEVLKKIEDYSISNWAEFEALVKKNLAMQQLSLIHI